MLLTTLPVGDPVHRYSKCLVVPFGGRRKVLSTCPLNGGFREDLTAVFNHDCCPGTGMSCVLRAPTYEGHMALVARDVGLDPKLTAAMSTSASMDNAAICTESHEGVFVTAVVTGGIEVNGGRVGDPASWVEVDGEAREVPHGTINIMLFFNVNLTDGALARALVTCTEGKVAAIQELLASSRYSMGLATGSGTDGTIVVCNAESDICLTNAGKHSKLGELIGRAVKEAVTEALNKQSNMNPRRQHDIIRRLDRFGITEQTLWDLYRERKEPMSRADFADALYRIAHRDDLVTACSLYAHLLDQLLWGLLSPEEVHPMGAKLLGIMLHRHGKAEASADGAEAMAERMIAELKDCLLTLLQA